MADHKDSKQGRSLPTPDSFRAAKLLQEATSPISDLLASLRDKNQFQIAVQQANPLSQLEKSTAAQLQSPLDELKKQSELIHGATLSLSSIAQMANVTSTIDVIKKALESPVQKYLEQINNYKPASISLLEEHLESLQHHNQLLRHLRVAPSIIDFHEQMEVLKAATIAQHQGLDAVGLSSALQYWHNDIYSDFPLDPTEIEGQLDQAIEVVSNSSSPYQTLCELLPYIIALILHLHSLHSGAEMQQALTAQIEESETRIISKIDSMTHEEANVYDGATTNQLVTTSGINVFSNAGEGYPIIGHLPPNSIIAKVAKQDGWVQIQHYDIKMNSLLVGWVQSTEVVPLITPAQPY